MILQEILKIIELDRANLEMAIEANRKLQEQEASRRLKQRDEEWLDKMESLLSVAISNLGEGRREVQAVGKFINEMRQWAKGEE